MEQNRANKHHSTREHQWQSRSSARQFNSHLKQPSKQIEAVLRSRIAVTSIPEYVSGWCWNGFESQSQPFLLAYTELIKAYGFLSSVSVMLNKA